jgi:nucleotide-binding universal stress UspA family protein
MSVLAVSTSPTTKLRNILFATDFSADSMHAAPYVAAMASKLGASVYLCHVVTPDPWVAMAPEAAPGLYEGLKEQAAAQLTALAHAREFAGFGPKTVVGSGPIEDALCNIVRENKIDLVVAGTHGRTGMRKLLMGSVVEEICRVAACPVLTVGPGLTPGREIKFNRIVFPTDLSEDSKKILPHLRRIAQEYNAQITVLHVMPEELITNPDAQKLAEPIRRNMMHMFEAELAGLNPEFLVGFGETVETVLRTARAKEAGLITMGIHNAFLPGVQLRSSVAYRIITNAPCPVLTAR